MWRYKWYTSTSTLLPTQWSPHKRRQCISSGCFPDVQVLPRIYLTLTISKYSGEMYFSKLKLTKDKQRSTMSQNRLDDLTKLSTEWDVMPRAKLDKHLLDFSAAKMCKQFNSV